MNRSRRNRSISPRPSPGRIRSNDSTPAPFANVSPGRRSQTLHVDPTPPASLEELRMVNMGVKPTTVTAAQLSSLRIVDESYDRKQGEVAPTLPLDYLIATRAVTPPPVRKSRSASASVSQPATPRSGVSRRSARGMSPIPTGGHDRAPWRAGSTTAVPLHKSFEESQPQSSRGRSRSAGRSSHNTSGMVSSLNTSTMTPASSKRSLSPRPFVTSKTLSQSRIVPGFGSEYRSESLDHSATRSPPPPSRKSTASALSKVKTMGCYSKSPRSRTPTSHRPRRPSVTNAGETDKLLQAYLKREQLERAVQERVSSFDNSYALAVGGEHPPAPPSHHYHTTPSNSPPRPIPSLATLDESTDDYSFTLPLHWAAREGRLKVVEALLERGADVSVLQHGKTALDIACEELEQAAINSSADVRERQDIVKLLQKHSHKPSPRGTDEFQSLGAGMYQQLVKTLPHPAWMMVLQMLEGDDLKKVSRTCMGLKEMVRQVQRASVSPPRSRSADLADKADGVTTLYPSGVSSGPHVVDYLRCSAQDLVDINQDELHAFCNQHRPQDQDLPVLQAVCVLLGNQSIEQAEAWPVFKYLLRSERSVDNMAAYARETHKVTWKQVNWMLKIFDERAVTMASVSNPITRTFLVFLGCLLRVLVEGNKQLPPLRLPKNFEWPVGGTATAPASRRPGASPDSDRLSSTMPMNASRNVLL